MKLSELAMSIAAYSRDYDPYEFADCFDTLEDGAAQVEHMLSTSPETVYDALLHMVLFADDAGEAKSGAQLLYAVSRIAKSAA